MEELAKYLRALVLLGLWNAQNGVHAGSSAVPKLELLLADSGFSHKDISEMLSKSQAAVAKAVSRGRATRRGAVSADTSVTEDEING